MKKYKLLPILMALVLAGCVSLGNVFDTKDVPKIEKGKTTQKEILKWFGNPVRLGVDDGEITWSYIYLKKSLFSPAIAKDLTVRFNKDGNVSSYSFTTTEDELDLKTGSNTE